MNNFYKKAFSIQESVLAIFITTFLTSSVFIYLKSIKYRTQASLIGSEFFLIKTSVNAFKSSFKYFPGDLPTATIQIENNTSVFSGDGDSYIKNDINQQTGISESYQAWLHLEKVGLAPLSGSVSGSRMNAGIPTIVGLNVPATRALNSKTIGYNIRAYTSIYLNVKKNVISLEDFSTINPSSIVLGDYSLNVKTMKALDDKIDTGNPTNGSLLAEGSLCINSNGTDYSNNTNDINTCKPIFLLE